MKSIKLLLVVTTILVTALSSCKKSGSSSAFDKSYSTWLAYKAKVNNSYSYIAVHDDASTLYSETTITVVQGTISSRSFISYAYQYHPGETVPVKVLADQWQETNSNGTLGTHGTTAADLLTLDDIYYKAQNLWLKADPSTSVVTFEANNNGMISTAGYAPNICQSDCFIGVHIKSITN